MAGSTSRKKRKARQIDEEIDNNSATEMTETSLKSQRKRQKTMEERKGRSKGKGKARQVDEELDQDSATDIIETLLANPRTLRSKQRRPKTTEERKKKKKKQQ